MEIYLVGGYVRDELLGIPPKDKDYVIFNCTEKEFFDVFPKAIKVGKKIPVYLIGRDEYTISEFKTINEDLLSRDLTINAIAKDDGGKIYAHPLAFDDLKNKVLRAICLENFIKDPLRVYRAARFCAQFPDFSMDTGLVSIMKTVGTDKDLMKRISKERVCQEVIKAIKSPKPSKFFSVLMNTRAISYWFKELEVIESQDDWLKVMDEVAGDEIMVWMAFSYGFLLNIDMLDRAVSFYQDLANRIGLPKFLYRAGINFIKYYKLGSDIFGCNVDEIRDIIFILHKQRLIRYFFEVVEKITHKKYLDKVLKFVEVLEQVKLPEKFKGLGPKSGEILRHMQIDELKKCMNLL